MSVTNKGLPLGSAWIGRGLQEPNGNWSLLYRQGHNSDGLELTLPWSDWVFPAIVSSGFKAAWAKYSNTLLLPYGT